VAGWDRVRGDGLVAAPEAAAPPPLTRADRHTARLARLRKSRWLSAGGVVLGLAAGLSLAVSAEERPLRVVGILVLAITLLMAPLLWALFRVPPSARDDR
jgi:hypothetical protein